MIDVNSEAWLAVKAQCEEDIAEGQKTLESFGLSELEYAATRGVVRQARRILALAEPAPQQEEMPTEYVA